MVVATACLLRTWTLNAAFLRAARAAFGAWFAARAAAFLPVMYFYYGVGLVAGIVSYLRGGSVAARRELRTAVYTILEGDSAGA